MPEQDRQPVYRSGECEIDLARREVRLRGAVVPMGARAFAIIQILARANGALVTKDELMDRVWSAGAIITDNTLQVHISAARKALGPYRAMLKTESGHGYRLVGDWTPLQERNGPSVAQAPPLQILPQPLSTNIPAQAFGLIGRAGIIEQLGDLLSAYRTVTLTGPGGIGKTALAFEVARTQLAGFGGGGWVVELASLSVPELVPTAISAVLGLRLSGAAISADSVARAIGDQHLLLVLDNCEHVIDAAAQLAETIVHLCPRVTVLATSREVLRIDGEYVFRVPPLDVPSSEQGEPSDLLGHSAVELFVARMRAQSSSFVPEGRQLSAITAICRHLDGIPLAIEFAAARAATLGVTEVASRLNDRFQLLTSGRRTALPRHQTLRATLDWSHELLPDEERRLLRRLAIFPAGFTLDAAEAVADAGGGPATIADGIASLVAKSLVNRDGSASDGRWRLLETIRAYALEKLEASGEGQQTARRHARYFHDLAVPHLPSEVLRISMDDVARYGREIDNIRVALDWSFSPAGDTATGIALTAAIAPVWLHLSMLVECRERSEKALNAIAPGFTLFAPLNRRLHVALGVALTLSMGPVERTRSIIARARALAESVNDLEAQLRVLWAQWAMENIVGEYRAAGSTADRFAELARQNGDESIVLVGEHFTGTAMLFAGNLREAKARLSRMIERYVAPANGRHTILFHFDQRAVARAKLARLLLLEGDVVQAKAVGQMAFEEARADAGTRCWTLQYAVCPIALMMGDIAVAEQAVAGIKDLATRLDATLWKILGSCWEGKLFIERGEFAAGCDLLQKTLDTCAEIGWQIYNAEFRGDLALGLVGLGQLGEALAAIEEALARANTDGEIWYMPELLRIKGEALRGHVTDGATSAAAACFYEAIALARDQGALFWELRSALSLARMQAGQEQYDEARDTLIAVYERFADGLATADLRAAKELLDSLPAPRFSPG